MKTLQECKDEVAAQTVYKRWDNICDELRGTDEYLRYLEIAHGHHTNQFKEHIAELEKENEVSEELPNGMTVEQLLEWLDKRCAFSAHQKDYVHVILMKLAKWKYINPPKA